MANDLSVDWQTRALDKPNLQPTVHLTHCGEIKSSGLVVRRITGLQIR